MSTPISPTTDATAGPVPQPVPSGSPTDADIRALAAQLTSMAASGAGLALSQGAVVALDATATPPTASITLSGSTTQIDGVRFLSSYTPVAGDTIQVLKQGGSLLILGHTADTGTGTETTGGWTQASLGTGFSHNGDSQGNLEYRKVMEYGSWKMQWRGAVALSGVHTSVLASPLDAEFIPASQRKVLAARGMGNGNSILDVQLQFTTSGTVVLQGTSYSWGGSSTGAAGSHSHYDGYSDVRLSGYLSQAGSDLGHSHYLGYTDTSADHTHSMGITVSNPDWISFNKVEYFL